MNACEQCGRGLTKPKRRFCSPECAALSLRRREVRACTECGEEFECLPSNPKRTCSTQCAGRSRSGAANCNFNGGLSECDGRTIIVHRDGSWSFYYRALMEMYLGRPLRSGEIVHHVNGDPSDDRIENLQVLSRAEHIEIHRDELLAARGLVRRAA